MEISLMLEVGMPGVQDPLLSVDLSYFSVSFRLSKANRSYKRLYSPGLSAPCYLAGSRGLSCSN